MMRLSEVALWTAGRLLGTDVPVRGVAIDTRQLNCGDLFVAIAGERVDGHDYLDAARAAGAVAALVSRRVENDLPQVLVTDTPAALGDLASAVRARSEMRVVGITGSNGKTTVKTLVASILSRHGRTHVNAGNFNNELGLPLTVLAMPPDTQFAVLEMGAGKPGDIAYLAAIARPDIGLVNVIAPAHLERMGSVEGVAETKGALYQALPADGVAIINAEDAFAGFFEGLAGTRKVLRFAVERRADVSAEHVQTRSEGSSFTLRTPLGNAPVALPLPGRHNVANALAAAAIALALEVPLTRIVEGLQHADGVGGRLRRRTLADGFVLIDDSYNANPGSVGAAIDTLALAEGERWLVLGDMAELGSDARAMHAAVGARARAAGIERLFAAGRLGVAAVEAFGARGSHHEDLDGLIDALRAQRRDGVTCLVKGSRSAGMERVVAALSDGEGAADAA